MRRGKSVSAYEFMVVEEIGFWLQQLREHLQFIQDSTCINEPGWLEDAAEFGKAFEHLRVRLMKLRDGHKLLEIMTECNEVMNAFNGYQREIINRCLTDELRNSGYIFDIVSSWQQSVYCAGLIKQAMENKMYQQNSQPGEVIAWLRFMSNAARSVRQNAEPLELTLIKQADSFCQQLMIKRWETEEWAAMLDNYSDGAALFSPLREGIKLLVQDFAGFIKLLYQQQNAGWRSCRINKAGLLHIQAEAEHFVQLLLLMEKGVIKHSENAAAAAQQEMSWPEKCEREPAVPLEEVTASSVKASAEANSAEVLELPEQRAKEETLLNEEKAESSLPDKQVMAIFDLETPVTTGGGTLIKPASRQLSPVERLQQRKNNGQSKIRQLGRK